MSLAILASIVILLAALFAASRIGAFLIARRHPPVGAFAEVYGTRIHHVHVPGPVEAELPPVVFIHGASSNLLDEMLPLRPRLEGRAEMLFLDRPGHGWSERGDGNDTPSGQAATLAALMDRLGIGRAIVVGHSFGGAVAAAFALDHPERTAGLVLVSAASHPWPGGATSWYYRLAALPGAGPVFCALAALPAGLVRIAGATRSVFSPNPVPDGYVRRAAIMLVLRPAAFRANAIDVDGLYAHVAAAAPRYPSISAPTVVISGDSDTVVYEEVHSLGLARDILGAALAWVRNLGHKPDWIAPELVAAAILKVAGERVDLDAAVRAAERRVAGDRAEDAGPDRSAEPAQSPPPI
ncbi:MAG: alpha/beta hydrolase [Rhizobiales bacterium]|nr:alpha/beta hydrolase [Hyphomicrobiales bacterium]OJU34260.1 MAG: alpha/beta hydrolase [Rhizobiales bacterium 68-8]